MTRPQLDVDVKEMPKTERQIKETMGDLRPHDWFRIDDVSLILEHRMTVLKPALFSTVSEHPGQANDSVRKAYACSISRVFCAVVFSGPLGPCQH